MLNAHVGIECLLVRKDLDEVKVVRGRRLAEQGERLDPGIAGTVIHECIEHRTGLVDELGIDIHVRDHEDLTGFRVARARIHGPLEQIAVPFVLAYPKRLGWHTGCSYLLEKGLLMRVTPT